jgi:hypothetical protein
MDPAASPTLVWGFFCQALFKRFLACLVLPFHCLLFLFSFFVRPQDRFFVPTCRGAVTPGAAAVKAGRRSVERANAGLGRPRLDGGEHGVTLGRVGTATVARCGARQRGVTPVDPRRARGQEAPSPHNLVFGESQMADSNHDAVMRIGGRLLGGGSILQKRH